MKDEDLEQRLKNLNSEFLESLYRNICRSLFEKDKLIFSFLLNIKLMQMSGDIKEDQFRFLLTGGVSLGDELPPNPVADWLSEKLWGEINRMSKLTNFTGFLKHFAKNLVFYKKMYDSVNPNEMELPSDISHYNKF